MSSWRNPYDKAAVTGLQAGASHRQKQAEENHKKILRRRTEDRLLREMAVVQSLDTRSNLSAGLTDLSRLGEIRADIDREEAERARIVEEGRHALRTKLQRTSILPTADDPEPFRAVRQIELGARCVAVTHSGATLWAGDADGTIRICDGVHGDVIHTIPGDRPPATPGGQESPTVDGVTGRDLEGVLANPVGAVTAMHATETHMWVGYSNGTVRVFDHTAFIHITEGRFHEGAVAAFADASTTPGAAGRTLSVGDDGCLVVWNTEERGFEAMCKIVLPSAEVRGGDESAKSGISCVTVVGGTQAYCGTLAGNVVVVNLVTAEVLHVIPAHTDAVLGICSMVGVGGFNDPSPHIFTCSADCSLAVWKRRFDGDSGAKAAAPTTSARGSRIGLPPDEPTGNANKQQQQQPYGEGHEELDGHVLLARNATPSPVLSLVADALNHRVWTGEQDGTVRVWLASAEDGFALEKALPPLPAPVLRLHTGPVTDALKVWTLGSTGVNKMWYSCTNRSELDLARTVQSLKAIATQDGVELDKWRETVAKLHHVNTRRQLQLSRLLLGQREDSLRRRYLWRWRLMVTQSLNQRRKWMVSKRMAQESASQLSRRYLGLWVDWTLAHQKRRIKTAYSRLLMANANHTAVQLYLSKMQAFARVVKNGKKKRDLVAIMGMQSQRSAARNVYRKWLKWLRGRQQHNRKVLFVSTMMRATVASLTRAYYAKWHGFVNRRRIMARRLEVVHVIMQQHAATRMRQCYLRWRRFALRRATRQRKQAVAQAVLSVSESGLREVALKKWHAFLTQRKLQRDAERRKAAEDDLDLVKARYAELEGVIAEKRRLDAMEEEIAEQQALLDQQELELKRLEMNERDLTHDIDHAADAARKQQQSLAEQFATLIAQLKSTVINFHQDAALILQLRDKAKSVPVTKLFLEAHQEVKRVVVDITKQPHLMGTTEQWPLTREKLAAVPGHQWNVVLPAIKTMIVAFDLMDRATRDGLTSDREIVTNAHWLQQMAELSNEHRRKTLGRGAARVK